MAILVTGSNGQLGLEIQNLSSKYNSLKFIFRDLPELNICDFEYVDNFIKKNRITSVINCAAYTNVDRAELETEKAKKVNITGVINIVNALKNVNGRLIHISTDYVFDGQKKTPYIESDDTKPLGVYGYTKRQGELAIINSDIDAIIIRTSWLYSSYGNNFVKTMFKLGESSNVMNIIYDQLSTPTYARDLASVCLEIISNKTKEKISANGKIYHYSNEGIASWYDFAIAVMNIGEINCLVKPIQTKDYKTEAIRPPFSVLDKSKIKKDFKIEIAEWKTALTDCISTLKNK